MTADEVIDYMRENGLTLHSRSGDYETMSFMTDPLNGEYVVHINVNSPYEEMEVISLIGMHKLSIGKISLPHKRLNWFIESTRAISEYGEIGRVKHRDGS